jgi:hypothetical protein
MDSDDRLVDATAGPPGPVDGPQLQRERLVAVLRAAPPGSALGGWSALAFDGLSEGLGAPARIIIPAHARRPRLAGVRIAYSTQLGTWVDPVLAPRRTVPARSLVDAAVWSPGPAAARAVLLRGLGCGAAGPAELAAALRARGPCRHRAVIEDVLTWAGHGALPPAGSREPGRRPDPAAWAGVVAM